MRQTVAHGGAMMYRGSYVMAVLLGLLVTSSSVRVSPACWSDLNVTNQVSDKANNSTLRILNGLSLDNSSGLREDVTPDAPECVEPPTSFPLQKYESTWSLFFVGVALCLGVWSAAANSLPLAAIIKHEQLHTPAYILMANMAAGDVLTGISFTIGSSGLMYVAATDTVPSDFMLRLRSSSILLSGMSSAYSLVALTAERYWFIVHGMSYVNNVTNGKCKVVIVFVWMWSLLLAVMPHVDSNCTGRRFEEGCVPLGSGLSSNIVIVVLVFVFIPMAAIFLLNLGIFWCLWKHMKAIAAQEAAVGAQPSVNRKSAITIVIITVVFLVGWMPIFVELARLSTNLLTVYGMMVFIILNSAINPIIYGFRLKEVRRYVARLFVNNQ
ncbi:melanocortin receptor 5-like isoform X5 [Branchiostoma floridae x Branchiostoma japonicum]